MKHQPDRNRVPNVMDSEERVGDLHVKVTHQHAEVLVNSDGRAQAEELLKPAVAIQELLGCPKGSLMQLFHALDQSETSAELIM